MAVDSKIETDWREESFYTQGARSPLNGINQVNRL